MIISFQSFLVSRLHALFPIQFVRWGTAFCFAILIALPNLAKSLKAEATRFMRVHGQTHPPYGFIEFCKTYASECKSRGFRTTRFPISPKRLSELDEVNRYVNRTIKPATDDEVYGIEEYWTFPSSVGDCEDYVVLKRRMLMNRGWPAGALLITVAIDEYGEGHAVLTARTAHGDFILDNKIPEIKLWVATPYHYIMRQSYINPKVWMSLHPPAAAASQTFTRLRNW